jgi:hypothetical protein
MAQPGALHAVTLPTAGFGLISACPTNRRNNHAPPLQRRGRCRSRNCRRDRQGKGSRSRQGGRYEAYDDAYKEVFDEVRKAAYERAYAEEMEKLTDALTSGG